MTDAAALLEEVWRDEWGRLLGGLIARTGRPDLAEDALAESFAQAAERWPRDGPPRHPAGWLAAVGYRRALDAERAEATARAKAPLIAVRDGEGTVPPDRPERDPAEHVADRRPGDARDERIRLLFFATHPALDADVRAALALRFVLGVPTARIATLFLVSTSTMAARLTRAKRRLASAGIPFATPTIEEWPARVDDVARTILLAFTAGYAPADDAVVRTEIAGDAVRLALVAADALPEEPVFHALASLVLLQHSRRDARVDRDGRIVLLAEQNRRRWRRDEIGVGVAALARVAPSSAGYVEELRLQAVIAAAHARAETAADTDWTTIARAYARLEHLTGSPIVRLNRAVALAEVRGPMAGLALLREVSDALPGHHRVALVRAELLRRDGRVSEAIAAYREAIAACAPGAERRHLESRLAELA